MARAYVVQKVKFISQLKDCAIVECNWQARLYSGIKLSGIFVYICGDIRMPFVLCQQVYLVMVI